MTESIERTLGRIEAKVDDIQKNLTKVETALASYEKRINGLETYRDIQKGKEKQLAATATFIGSISGALVSFLIWIFPI